MKKYIPNILTLSRLLITPLLIYLGLTNHIITLIIVAILITLTDFLDGYLARKWQVTSAFGAKADMIADKFLAITLLILLIMKINLFFYILILEIIIAIVNIYIFIKSKYINSLLIGKIKTWCLFTTILAGFMSILFPWLKIFTTILALITIFIQLIALYKYVSYYFKSKKTPKEYTKEYQEFCQIIEPFINNKEYLKRKKYPHHINESVYEHTLRVAYDCFKIGRKLKLDYHSLTIAALLHDFYEKPWQYDTEKKPFLQMHAFTHAHNAVLNAQKNFGELITPKIANIMETHMFPVNKKIPRSKEAWLLTIVDKADSMDFILHPIILYHIFRKEEIKPKNKKTKKNVNKKKN